MRNWPRRFALACGAISVGCWGAAAQQAKPAIALLDASDAAQWQMWTSEIGWQVIAPQGAGADIDARVKALEAAVHDSVQKGGVDPARIYLAGRGDAAAAVFYAVSRAPDLWAAAAALGGSPQPAIDSDRLYAANFTNVPVLWLSGVAQDQAVADKLKAAGIPLEWRAGDKVPIATVFQWLAGHIRPEDPAAVDCETNSPQFASCYWIQMTKFDAAERNDVLPSSRIAPENRAMLDLGAFGFMPDSPGPGVLVSSLPEKHSGKLKIGDRIVELDGRRLADARQFIELMAQVKQERPAVVLVERGKERFRIETNLVLPKRTAAATARVQASYDAAAKEVDIVSRTVTEMRVTIPAAWVPAVLNWNGVALEKMDAAGCRLLSITKELENAAPCP